MNTNITHATLKIAFETPAVFAATRELLAARVHHETIREQVGPVQQATIDAASLTADLADGSPITKMNDCYLSTDEPACEAMHTDYKRRLIAAGGFGLSVEKINEGYCPELVAGHNVIRAETKLIDLTTPALGIAGRVLTIKDRKHYLDITIELVTSLSSFKSAPART